MNERNNNENEERHYADYFNLKKRQKEFEEGNVPIAVFDKKSRYQRYKELMKGENDQIRKISERVVGEEVSVSKTNLGSLQLNQAVSTDGGEEIDAIQRKSREKLAEGSKKKSEQSIFDVLLPEWFKGADDLGKLTFRSMAKTARTCLPCCAGPLAGAVLLFFSIVVIVLWLFGIA